MWKEHRERKSDSAKIQNIASSESIRVKNCSVLERVYNKLIIPSLIASSMTYITAIDFVETSLKNLRETQARVEGIPTSHHYCTRLHFRTHARVYAASRYGTRKMTTLNQSRLISPCFGVTISHQHAISQIQVRRSRCSCYSFLLAGKSFVPILALNFDTAIERYRKKNMDFVEV